MYCTHFYVLIDIQLIPQRSGHPLQPESGPFGISVPSENAADTPLVDAGLYPDSPGPAVHTSPGLHRTKETTASPPRPAIYPTEDIPEMNLLETDTNETVRRHSEGTSLDALVQDTTRIPHTHAMPVSVLFIPGTMQDT